MEDKKKYTNKKKMLSSYPKIKGRKKMRMRKYPDGHERDHTKQINVTNNEVDTEKTSNSHKGVHTQHIYMTNNEEDTEKPSDGHNGDHIQNKKITNNEEDTENVEEISEDLYDTVTSSF
ncbi:hypothetical protein QTP88_017077 [Uroleucon formosanum]